MACPRTRSLEHGLSARRDSQHAVVPQSLPDDGAPTVTERGRARTYYHFLGLDVEKSASRTTDPVALADTNNPPMHNPACTVCHSVLDPVAGAFQNYGDDGLYKDQWGGLDSLDAFYKDEGDLSLSIQAESWAERETLVWPVSLAAGIQTLKVVVTNDFYDADTGADGTIYLDRLEVRAADGQVLVGHEFEELGPPIAPWGPCGNTQYNPATERDDHLRMWNGGISCAFYIDVEVPSHGAYDVEVVAWADRYEQYEDGQDDFAELSVAANSYEHERHWVPRHAHPGLCRRGGAAPRQQHAVAGGADRRRRTLRQDGHQVLVAGDHGERGCRAARGRGRRRLRGAIARCQRPGRGSGAPGPRVAGTVSKRPYTRTCWCVLTKCHAPTRSPIQTRAPRALTPVPGGSDAGGQAEDCHYGRAVGTANLHVWRTPRKYRLLYGGIDSDGNAQSGDATSRRLWQALPSDTRCR